MEKIIKELLQMPVQQEGPEKRRKSLQEMKSENAQAMQERANKVSPELVEKRRKSEEMLAVARAQAQEAMGIDARSIGEVSKRNEADRMQDIAAKKLGYGSGAAMKKQAVGEKEDFMGRTATWLRKTFGINVERNKAENETKKAA